MQSVTYFKRKRGGGIDTVLAMSVVTLLGLIIAVYFSSLVYYFVAEEHVNISVQQCVATASKSGKLDSTLDNYLKSRLQSLVKNGLSSGFTIKYYNYNLGDNSITEDLTTSVDSTSISASYGTAKTLTQGTLVGISVEESGQSLFGNVVSFVTGTQTIVHIQSYKEVMVEKW